MSENKKELWRKRWLGSINELTSIELQRKSWMDRKTSNPHWSFVEFMCSYFDDLVIDNDYQEQLKESWISNSEFEIIKNWHNALSNYESPTTDHDREAILEDENWQKIVGLGLEAKRKLSEHLENDELKILNERIDY
jgi:hypothetical protein